MKQDLKQGLYEIRKYLFKKELAVEAINVYSSCTRKEAFFLDLLAHNSGTTEEDIAAILDIDTKEVTRVIRQLGKNGLIKKNVSFEEVKKFLIYLTPKGEELHIKILERENQAANTLIDKVSCDEKNELLSMLKVVVNKLEKVTTTS